MSRSPDAIYARRRHQSAKVAYSHKPRRVELREQLRRPLAEIAKNKVVGEIVYEDPDRWSQSSAGREYEMKGYFLGAPTGEDPKQASFSHRSRDDFGRQERNSRSSGGSFNEDAEFARPQDRVECNNCVSFIGPCQSPTWWSRVFLKAQKWKTCNVRWMNQDRAPVDEVGTRDEDE